MSDKHYIRNYFKVAGKIVGNTLTIAILASIISFLAFKNFFNFVLWVSAAVLFIMLPLLVASFFAVLIVDVNSSEKMKNWQKTIISGILALVGLALARLAAIPCVGLGWNDSLTAKILNQVIIGFMVTLVTATLIELVGCGKNALRDKIEGTNLSYYKLKLNSGVFYLTELQVLIASIFVASLFSQRLILSSSL